MKRTSRALGVVAIAAGLLAPAAALAAPTTAALADDPGTTCQVTGGELTWGVKEAFRSYISGTIANGEWTVSDGAGYETPSFSFGDASGEIDAATGEGSVSFSGTVNFTGHEGVLNLTIANPTVEFVGDGSARLLLDTESNDDQGETAIDETQVSFAKIAEAGDFDPASGSLSVTDAGAVLTAEGAEAFSGFYATGESLDPISFDVELGPCAAPVSETETAAPVETEPEPISAEQNQTPWLPIGIGAAALVVIAVTLTMLLTGRKKTGAAHPEANAPEDPSENSPSGE